MCYLLLTVSVDASDIKLHEHMTWLLRNHVIEYRYFKVVQTITTNSIWIVLVYSRLRIRHRKSEMLAPD